MGVVGLLTGVTELDGTTVGFGYDALYRLTSDSRVGTNPYAHTYQYDLAGNPTTVNGQFFATFDNANKIATVAGGSVSHDGDGNLTSISGTSVPTGTFIWDDLSRMTSYTTGGVTRTFGYDASGTRIWSQTGANPKKFYIFDGDLLLGEVDSATGLVAVAYTWGANGLVSQRLPTGSSWYHFGPQGETRQLTNAAGAVTDTYFCSPYGALTGTFGTTSNPFRFGGQFGYYAEADLYLCGARWFNPFIGRWITRDPIEYNGGPNLYEYCHSDPVDLVDPNGLDAVEARQAVHDYRFKIQRIADAFGIQPELLAGVVYVEMYAGGRRWGNWLNNTGSVAEFIIGRPASIGVTQVTIDPKKAKGCESFSGRLRFLENYDVDRQLGNAAQLLRRWIMQPNRYPDRAGSLTPYEMSIILTEYNGKRKGTPADEARPSEYGRRFLRAFPQIRSNLFSLF